MYRTGGGQIKQSSSRWYPHGGSLGTTGTWQSISTQFLGLASKALQGLPLLVSWTSLSLTPLPPPHYTIPSLPAFEHTVPSAMPLPRPLSSHQTQTHSSRLRLNGTSSRKLSFKLSTRFISFSIIVSLPWL